MSFSWSLHQFHLLWVHCPGIRVASPHRPLGPHSPGALKFIWYNSGPCNSSTRFGSIMYWWGSNAGLKRLCDVAGRLMVAPPEKKKKTHTEILLFLRGLGPYCLSCQDSSFTVGHKVVIRRSVHWFVYELDSWGLRVEFSAAEETVIFSAAWNRFWVPLRILSNKYVYLGCLFPSGKTIGGMWLTIYFDLLSQLRRPVFVIRRHGAEFTKTRDDL
jgi:hypothetical protein